MKRIAIITVNEEKIAEIDGVPHFPVGVIPVPDDLARDLERVIAAAEMGVKARKNMGWGKHYLQGDTGYHGRVTKEADEAIARVRAAAGLDEETEGAA